jgi:hypothetical protein
MSTLLLTSDIDNDGLVAQKVRLRDRVGARLRAVALERELAEGVPPESCPTLALRAQTLISPSARRSLARELRRVVSDARGGHAWLLARIPGHREAILETAEDLEVIAERLEEGPVAARGVAQVRVLLTDGTGPLYFHGDTSRLRNAAAAALRGLDLAEAA